MQTQPESTPAARVIEKLGGIDATAAIVGRHRSVVNRWVLPKESGGTGGTVPGKHIPALLDHARARGIDLRAEDFFPEPKPTPKAGAMAR